MPSILKYLLIVLLCHCEVDAEKKSCTKFPEAPEPTSLSLLRKKLTCKYDVETPPLNASNTRLKLHIYLNRNRLEYVWHDDRLKWNEAEYKNHSLVYMKAHDIWSPTIVDPGIGYFSHPSYVLVLPDGQVNYLLWWQMTGHCKPTYASWTDKRICSISFQLEPAEKLLLRDHFLIKSLHSDIQSGSWNVVDVTRMKSERISKGNLTDPIPFISKIDTTLGLITFEIHLQRNTAVMDATIFSPAAVLFLLVLASTWIPCHSSIRLALLALTTLMEIFLMHFATRAIPTLPGRFSDFAVLYRDMVLVSGAAFFEWYIAFMVASKKIASSGRLQSFAGTASQSSYAFTRRILLIPSNPPKAESGTPEGAFLSVILDRVTFVILLVVFITVMILSAHRPMPVE